MVGVKHNPKIVQGDKPNVRAAVSGRTRELERLVVELYARGLSTRDIEERGHRAAVDRV
jgi:hypothetical protein